MRRRKFWGWGYEGEGPTHEQQTHIGQLLTARYGWDDLQIQEPPRVEDLDLPAPWLKPPDHLAAICSTAAYDRAGHSYGKAFRDIVRAFRRQYPHPPDIVAYPKTEDHVVQLLDWCASANAAAIPYGGGSSVVGGVEPRIGSSYAGAVSIDLGALDRVVEIDRESRAARIQGGILGPALEDQLRPHKLTLRHFPQSFELSTLGGWIATRSGGHFATLYTHIDDFVESLRVITPAGLVESRRLPGSGAGPSPDRLFIGSEGSLGIITEAWMRLQDRPTFRNSVSVTFIDFHAAAHTVRQISQTGLYPSNCRLLDAGEALTAGAGDGTNAVLLIAFESADHSLDTWMARALECCADNGGVYPQGAGKTRTDESATREGSAGAWRQSFLGAPYLRDALIGLGVISETFETAITWNRFAAFHANVTTAVGDALQRICGGGTLTCRFTHVYPDGPAPYYTILAPSRAERQLEQWDEIKAAAAEAVIANGGTITHHHAVGRDHQPWYDRQRPQLFATALSAAKSALDPHGILNPGVLLEVGS